MHGIGKSLHFGKIYSKIMLNKYKKYSDFWNDVGVAVQNFLTIYPDPDTDMHNIGLTIQ
jgi:hypothetical protein